MTNSSWKVSSWTTPTTTVSVPPVPSEVSPESKSQISLSVTGQFASFVQENYPTFISFVKHYYKSQELKGYCFDVIQNWADYYNIDNYGGLVTETTLISALTTTSDAVDVESTRDFPDEGLLMVDDEIIYYEKKGSTLFQGCARGFNAIKAVGEVGTYQFESTTAATHELGAKVVNLNNIFPLYVLGKFKEQFLATYPKNFASGVTESTVIKRIKDFYASKGSTRSFQFVLRTLFGVESEVNYPRERIFKPSDAYYTSREVIRAVAVSGDPIDLVGQVLYQENDANDPNVASARIYVKGVVEVFTASGTIFEIDVDTNNSLGTFVTPYKSTLANDLGGQLVDQVVTVDSTIGWPEQNGRFRIEDEIINYSDKTVTQFLGCTRARENTLCVAHDAGQEVFAAFKIYGYSNVDNSEIQLKVYGGTKGVVLTDGGRYYLPDSKVTTPAAPGFDAIDPIWDSFTYNVRRALRGESATLGTVAANGSVRCTVRTKEKHRLKRNDVIRILNAPEDVYNNMHDVAGIINDFEFEFIFSSTPAGGITGFEFYIAREFAFGRSTIGSINNLVKDYTTDVQNTYKSSTDAIVTSTGVPSHNIGPFGSGDLNPGNQRYLKRIPLVPSTKSTKTATPVGQIGISSNGVPFFSYKGESKNKYGGLKSITKLSGGSGYDITNPPTVEFEEEYKINTQYSTGTRVRYNGNRYRALGPGTTPNAGYPTHTTGDSTIGQITWEYEGEAAAATVSVKGSVTAINVTTGGSGYTTEPIVSITGGGATADNQASAIAQITSGTVTGISLVSGGSGYTSVPTITITGGNGSGATATATCRGPVDTINITDAGGQYTYEPTIKLISGSGAVAYPSILNGKIESIIVTFGGSGYFGAPDVIITGDGVGATAFAQVDLSTNIVTGVVITNKGAGYSAGATTISIVYPGSGAQFQTNLTELTFNEAATYEELGVPSNQFTNRKTVDSANGTTMQGENYLIYGGEYGYLYNPKMLRFLLRDNIDANMTELNPTSHSPIIGWAYDGHPIYGPYGFEDAENTSPYNSYKLMVSSYNVKSSRDALLSGLTDPMGTYIEDYEYTEGYGDLDQYNGRFCVTPEYPNGVYAYFATIKGSAGEPKFPYFVGPNFYSEADAVNWNGNGLQKNFTEDAVRYKAPFIGTDNIVAKRKQLDNRVDFFLALEDTTTLIVMETGEILTYLEDGIGYFSYYPVIRGGTADSMVVSGTNKYSSANIDQYLVEGGGKEYKVNDRLQFDNTGTGGEGVSAIVSAIEGTTVNNISMFEVTGENRYFATVNTSENHYLQVGDSQVISVSDNLYTRSLTVKIIGGRYHFKYADMRTMKLVAAYQNTTAYNLGDLIYVQDRVYLASTGTSGSSAPTHESGTVSDGSMDWTYLRKRTDGNLYQDGWSSITGGSGYTNGTYSGVPLTSGGSGKGAVATIVVSGGAVTTVTLTDMGTAYNVGDTITASDLNLGNGGGSGFTITLTQVETEAQIHLNKAHQTQIGDIVNISGVSPASYNKTDYTVVRSDTLNRFTVKRNFATVAAATITNAEVYVQEPKLKLIDGHKYTFDTSDTSNIGKTLAFTLDSANTDIFTYKNITEEQRDSVTGDQNSITILVKDLPGIFYYFDIQGSTSGNYFQAISDPIKGTQQVFSRTDTSFTYEMKVAPESGYTTGITYTTNSIYPSGGIATISIGDPGRNYSSLPKLSGSSRAGSGATAVSTISGSLSNVSVTNQGSGYNNASLPTGVVTLPDYVDLTVTNILGSFVPNEILISQTTQGNQTARGQVINWNPVTSVLRIKPLRNERTGAANKGYIMFSTGVAETNNLYSADSQASISAISGTQALVATVVSGGGALTEVTVTNQGSNYRSAPDVIFDDPYYGSVDTVTTLVQPAGNGTYTADQTTTGVTQTSVAPVNGTGATFTVVTDGNGRISTVTVTAGGTAYALGDVITFDGTKIPGGASNEDFTVTVNQLAHANPATISTLLNASVDTITVTNTGSGYLSAPNIEVSGGNGINAKFNATILNEGVQSINIESGGVQYQSAPVVNITQKTGSGASILLKSSDMGKILKIAGDNITFNYSHDRTLKPELNTTYNLQLTRTQVLDYFTITNGGANFVSTPEIVLEGGSGSLYETQAIVENEVIQVINIINEGRGFLAAPTVKARVTHTWVGLTSNNTLNFPYNTKIPTGTKVTLQQLTGQFPGGIAENTTYYAVAATTANGLADNQIKLATSLANANLGTTISFTSAPVGDPVTGQTYFTLQTTDLGDVITAFMKPATFSVGERIYQGASTASYTAYGYVKNWDASGRVVSVEIVEGEFLVGEPVFGEETAAFGQIHEFTRADAVFEVSPISTSATTWEKTTGFLDLNEQRLYDSDRYQEFSYDISSSININDWKNPLKYAAHPAGFKVVGTQVLSQASVKDFRSKPSLNLNAGNSFDWWVPTTNSIGSTFNGTTYIIPKPSARATGKMSQIQNFALGKADYTAAVPTEVQVFGKQLLDIQKILSCIAYKADDISDRSLSFDGSSSSIVDVSNNRITLTGHNLLDDQRVIYNSGGDRFQDARDLVIKNIDYIVEEVIGDLNYTYPSLVYNSATCARDTRLILAAFANDLRYGGNQFSLAAINSYVGQTVSQGNAYIDAANLLKDNKELIAAEAVYQMLQDQTVGIPSGYPGVPGGSQNCEDDIVDVIEAIAYNLRYGGNSEVWDAANYYVNTVHLDGEETQSVWAFNKAKEFAAQIIINTSITIQGQHGYTQTTNTGVTFDASICATVDAAMDTLFNIVTTAISNDSLSSVTRTNPANHILHIEGEETETIHAINKARDLMNLAVVNNLPAGTYTTINPVSDLSITLASDSCATVTSAITTLAKLMTDGIDNPSTLPQLNEGNYPNIRTGTPVTGLVNGNEYYVKYVDANTIEISSIPGGPAINLTSVGAGSGHTLRCFIDGVNTQFKLTENGTPFSTRIGKTPDKDQLFVLANGIVQNPSNYTYASDIITFNKPLLGGSSVIAMYYDRQSYASSFQLDTIGDEIKTFDVANGLTPGSGYSNGTYTNIPLKNRLGSGSGATADITVAGNEVTNVVLNQAGNGYTEDDVLGLSEIGEQLTTNYVPSTATYTPASGLLVLDIGNHTLTTNDTVRIANDALIFSCSYGGGGNQNYPRSTDPIGNLFDVPITATTGTTITVNALQGTSPTNTDAHTWQGLKTYQFQPSKVKYIPATGEMTLTAANHGMYKGDRIQIATDSLTFTCSKDNNSTNHTYPRISDPVGGAWVTIDSVTTDAFTVNVGRSERFQFTPSDSTYNAVTGDMTLTIGDHSLLAPIEHTATNAVYTPADGKVVITVTGHGMSNGDRVWIVDDSLSFTCTHGAGTKTYPRSTDPISNKFVEVFDVSNDTFTIQCLETVPSTNTTTHTFAGAQGAGIRQARDFVTVEENGLIFTCEMDDRATRHSYPRATDPAFNAPLAVKAVSGNVITVNVGKSPIVNYTPTDATYDPTTGVMELTIGSHNIIAGKSIKLAEGAVTFTCAQDGNTATKSYPRSLTDGFDVTGVNYNPDNGIMTVTSLAHGMVNGDWIKFKQESLTFTCSLDGNVAKKQYPRATDYAYDRWLKVSNVTNNTFDVVVLDTIPSTNTNTHLFSALPTRGPETVAYNATSGIMTINVEQFDVNNATYNATTGDMVLTIGTHNLTTLNKIRLDTDSLSWSCEYNGVTQTKTYPRSNGNDYVYNVDIPITSYTPTSITINVNGGQGAISHAVPHTFIGATAKCVKTGHGLSNGDFIKLKDDSLTFSCTQGLGNKTYPRASQATYTAGAGTTYDPNTGLMVVTTTINHAIQKGDKIKFDDGAVSFSCTAGSFPHTYVGGTVANAVTVVTDSNTQKDVTNAVYNPTNGQVELTIGNHSYTTSDTVKIAANSLTFTCDEDSNATTHTYPRITDPAYEAVLPILAETANTITVQVGTAASTAATAYPRSGDYASGKWLEVYSRTANTFTVKVLSTIPSTNIAPHTFTTGAVNGITLKDPASQEFLPVSNVTFNSFDVQVLNTVPSTNTTPHTFILGDADAITIAPFEKKRDPFFDTALKVTATTATTISVDVLTTEQSTNTYSHTYSSALTDSVITGGNYTHKFIAANAGAVKTGDRHTFVTANANSVTRGIVTHGVYAYNKLADAGRLIRANLEFIATTAYGRMLAANPSFNGDLYKVKCIRDTKLICDAVADNVEFGGNDATYDAANFYVGTVHLTGEEDQSVEVFNAARDICREVMRNITVTTNSTTQGSQIKDLTITNDSGNNVYDTNDCTDVASTITTLFGIVTTAVGTTAGGSGNLNSITRTSSGSPDFQIKVGTVTFDGSDTTFTAQVGGSTQVLPAQDNFLIFLNSTLQVKGSTESYTYTGSTLTFNEAPLSGMDFYGFYFGKLELIDDLTPFFDNSKKNFTMKRDNEPISLESDNTSVIASNNLLIFINGVFQEPQTAYNLRGSIIEFSEAPRAGSDCTAFIFSGSAEDVLVSKTYNSVDPGDRLQVVSEGNDRLIATVSSSTSIDSYEYVGLRPIPAEFVATVSGQQVTQVTITNPGSNYENPPFLLFQGGGGGGAFAETEIEEGSGKVIGIKNLKGGNGYVTVPTVLPTHPLHLERKQRNRIISDSNLLGNSFLTSNVTAVATTLNLQNVWYDVSQKYGFPDEAEVIIPFYDTVKQHWTAERILYGAKNTSANTLTVATGGRGYRGTTAHAHTILTGTFSSSGNVCTVTTSAAHYLTSDMYQYLDFTSGMTVSGVDHSIDGSYKVTVTGTTSFTVEIPYGLTTSGNVSLLPEVRLRSL